MDTYFILDKYGLLKIGKSKDFKSRISQIKTANPHIIFYWKTKGDYEKQLHKYFNYYIFKGEWYDLRKEYLQTKSIMTFRKWIILEIMTTVCAFKLNKLDNLIEIRMNRNILK